VRTTTTEHSQTRQSVATWGTTARATETPTTQNPLDAVFFDGHERQPIQPHAPPAGAFSHWLTLEQIRKMQRMRRSAVIQAMEAGELPFERRGRIRYARLADVFVWEERRLTQPALPSNRRIDPDLADLAG